MTSLPVVDLTQAPHPLWKAAQAAGVLAVALLVAGLFAAPDLALDVLWNGAVPVLPAVFLISPPIWRNVCPLATLNMLTTRGNSRSGLTWRGPADMELWGGVGILLLLVLVPARRLVFNASGPVLAVTIVLVGLLALAMGLWFAAKSGFCNAICPVLPVERLYGQSPLLRIGNPRCQPCVQCTRTGCLDRSPQTAAVEATELPGRSRHWILTPFGLFALAFPGFVFAYNKLADVSLAQLTDVSLAQVSGVYGTILLWMLASLGVGLALSIAGLGRTWLLRLSATSAIGVYYWFGAISVQSAWELPDAATPTIRILAIGLIAFWFATSIQRSETPGVQYP